MTSRHPVRLLVVLALLLGSVAGISGAGAAADDPVPLDRHGRGYYVVQLDGPIEKSEIDALRLAGAGLVSYLPDFAYKARMTPDAAVAAAGVAGVVSVTPVPAEGKLAPDLAASGIYRVRVERDADAGAVAAAIAAAGVEVLSADGRIVMVSGDLAGMTDVAWVENLLLRERHNEYGAGVIIGANVANQSGYDGSTQIVAVADTGLGGGTAATAHPDIPASRIVNIYDWTAPSVHDCYRVTTNGAQDPSSGHGTHVAVSVVGDGDTAGRGKGTAPAARLVFQAVVDHLQFRGSCAVNPNGYYLIGIPDDFTPLLQQAYNAGARIHSDSWGSNVAGTYTSDSRTVDQFTWNNRSFLMTTSAGNEGIDVNRDGVVDLDSTGSPATAKNLLTVGASENDRQGNWQCQTGLGNGCTGQNNIFTYGGSWPADYPVNPLFSDPSAGNAQQMAAFSSRGPTNDGRIKPDVVAPGTWILSGYSSLYRQGFGGVNPQNGSYQNDGWGTPLNGFYKYMGGTSMSNPIVAGGAAVVRDYYQKAHNHSASAALTKATLINSAVDLLDENNDGANDNDYPIPNNHEGWGRVDVAAATRGSAQFFDSPAGLVTGGSSTQTFTVEPGATFKATLVWSDYPSTEAAAKNLVNDLDITVTGPGGVVYRGNVFAGGWSATGGAADRTNNVENVYVPNAAGGTWTVAVTGFNGPFGPQPFALVVDGAGTGGGNQPPSADFTFSCSGLSCSFTDASTDSDGSIVSRVWTFGDGTTSTATNPPKVYATGGSYQVRLTVTDDDGATDFEQKTVVVTGPGGGTTMHVGDLDATAFVEQRTWGAIVTVLVASNTGSPVQGATVSGTWRRGGTGSCVTTATGRCTITLTGIKVSAEQFTVTGVTHATLSYTPAANTDPDGDSNGTTITIQEP